MELILVPGARPVDLLRKLNENQPQIVQFSSHGSADEIILESEQGEAEASGPYGPSVRSADDRDMKKVRPDDVESEGFSPGQPHVVKKSALVKVLRCCNEGNLRLVVLIACDTRLQAELLTEVVECVVSMNRSITDKAAIKFAASFYGALAFGRSVQKAFEQGVARLSAEGIAEAATPELVVRAGVDASQIVLVGPPTTNLKGDAQHRDSQASDAVLAVSNEFECIEVERMSEVTIIRFKGKFPSDHASYKARAELSALMESDANRKFVFRLDVRHATSTMLSTLVWLNKRVIDRDGKLLFCDVSPLVMEVIRTYALDRFLQFATDRNDAFRQMNAPQ